MSRKMNFLMFCGTISGCAAQLAFLMGANNIELYGCSFSHNNGHYFYESDYIGTVSTSQRNAMDSMLYDIRNAGVKIHIFGDTMLTQYDTIQ